MILVCIIDHGKPNTLALKKSEAFRTLHLTKQCPKPLVICHHNHCNKATKENLVYTVQYLYEDNRRNVSNFISDVFAKTHDSGKSRISMLTCWLY